MIFPLPLHDAHPIAGMVATPLKSGTDTELRTLLGLLVDSIGETLTYLVGQTIKVERGEMLVQDPESALSSLSRPSAVARGTMDKDYAGKSLLTAIEIPDAISMAGLLMMTPDHVVEEGRATGL